MSDGLVSTACLVTTDVASEVSACVSDGSSGGLMVEVNVWRGLMVGSVAQGLM